MKNNIFKELKVKNILLCILGSCIVSFGLYNVHCMSGITEGGILGMTLFLNHWFKISPAISSLVMNAVCYVFAVWVLGKSFAAYSVVSGVSFSLFYAVFEQFPPLWPSLADMPLLSAVLGAVFVGVGVGVCIRAGGAPGGDDALAMGLSTLLKIDIRIVYFVFDVVVLALSLSYLKLFNIAVSFVSVTISTQLVGLVQKIKKNEKTY